MDVNLSEGTITATKVETMGMIGNFNNWDGDAVMTWNAESIASRQQMQVLQQMVGSSA